MTNFIQKSKKKGLFCMKSDGNAVKIAYTEVNTDI